MRSTPRGLSHRRRGGLLKTVGAIFAAVVAILLVVAPASQATTPSPTPSPSNQQFQNSISGFLRDDARAPIADVTITAKSGDFTGTAKSGANGSWTIGVPVQGTYEVELDESTLPEGIKLADGQENPATSLSARLPTSP